MCKGILRNPATAGKLELRVKDKARKKDVQPETGKDSTGFSLVYKSNLHLTYTQLRRKYHLDIPVATGLENSRIN